MFIEDGLNKGMIFEERQLLHQGRFKEEELTIHWQGLGSLHLEAEEQPLKVLLIHVVLRLEWGLQPRRR